jgi:tetratricopeptide (TPR) repeat protein
MELIILLVILVWIAVETGIWERFWQNKRLLRQQTREEAVFQELVKQLERENGDRTNATHLEGVGTFKIAAGNYREGIVDLTRAIALNPAKASLYCNRAQAFYLLEDWGQAVRDYRKTIELDAEEIGAYIGLARVFLQICDYREAIATCNGAVLLDENEAIVYTLRARAYWKLGDRDRARRDCDRAEVCDPNHVEVQHLRTELR